MGGDAKQPGFDTSGVSLRYHKHKDFVKLPKNQKDELSHWQRASSTKNYGGGTKKLTAGKNDPLKKFKSTISAFKTKQHEVMQAMADAQQAGIFVMMAGSPYPSTKVVVGSMVASPIADT